MIMSILYSLSVIPQFHVSISFFSVLIDYTTKEKFSMEFSDRTQVETDMTIEKLTETFPLGEPLRSAFEFPRHPFNRKLPALLAPLALSA